MITQTTSFFTGKMLIIGLLFCEYFSTSFPLPRCPHDIPTHFILVSISVSPLSAFPGPLYLKQRCSSFIFTVWAFSHKLVAFFPNLVFNVCMYIFTRA